MGVFEPFASPIVDGFGCGAGLGLELGLELKLCGGVGAGGAVTGGA
jgi:hypothetical protein